MIKRVPSQGYGSIDQWRDENIAPDTVASARQCSDGQGSICVSESPVFSNTPSRCQPPLPHRPGVRK